ncbi:hypothetical protein AB0L57_27665 [Nocardia sp. NPDC052254]|uniref:hypothetical protein n=1 Tax=Nocardia sp. NPDC052254 TaxID=3155681 RepID=UPI003435B5E8
MSGNQLSPPDDTDGDLLLAAEAAEAEAEAAEATATAARARARAAQLRHRAAAAGTGGRASSANTGEAAPGEADTPTSDVPAVTAPADETTTPEPAPAAASAAGGAATATSESVVSADVGDEPADSGRDDRKQRLRRLGIALPHITCRAAGVTVAAVVLCAGLGSSGYLLWHHHDVTAQQHREAEFVAAARQGVTSLTSLDFNHAADDVKRVLDDSTGTFRDDFRTRADDFAKVIQQSQVATEGHVNSAAVQSMTGDSAVVLVAATSKVTNSAGAKQEPRAWRLSVTVERVDGQLKMSKVEFVP